MGLRVSVTVRRVQTAMQNVTLWIEPSEQTPDVIVSCYCAYLIRNVQRVGRIVLRCAAVAVGG